MIEYFKESCDPEDQDNQIWLNFIWIWKNFSFRRKKCGQNSQDHKITFQELRSNLTRWSFLQAQALLVKFGLNKVFLATDADDLERSELTRLLPAVFDQRMADGMSEAQVHCPLHSHICLSFGCPLATECAKWLAALSGGVIEDVMHVAEMFLLTLLVVLVSFVLDGSCLSSLVLALHSLSRCFLLHFVACFLHGSGTFVHLFPSFVPRSVRK